MPIVPDRRKYTDTQQSLVDRFEKAWEVRRRELEEDMRKLEMQFLQLKPVEGGNMSHASSQHENLAISEHMKEPHVLRDPATGGRICRVTFDVRDFEPEDIRVTTEGNSLVVQGVQKVTSSRGGAVNVIKKDFMRKVTLPIEANRSQIQARLSADGILTVQTPMFSSSAITAAESYGTIQRHNKPKVASQRNDTRALNTYGTLPRKKGDQALIKTRNSKVLQQPAQPHSPYMVYPGYSPSPKSPTRKKLKLAVDLGRGFTPGDIIVKNIIPENKFVVEASRTKSSLDGPTRYIKAYRWPVQVDPESICAILKGDGRLTITAYPIQDTKQPTVLWR